ncbi:unnamed protein product, partial [Rotaria sp. Silwood1]
MEQDKDTLFTKEFDNWEEFQKTFEYWCITYYQLVNVKRTSMKYNEKLMKDLFDRFRYQHVMYVCHHSGPIRRHIKDGSRPNEESARLDCQFYFKMKKFTRIIHLLEIKKLEENNEAYDLCKTLIAAKTSTYNNRKLISDKFDINLTRKDINNFKQKLKFNLVGDKSDPELLKTWINQILNDNSENSVQIKINDNGVLECLYIQTSQMKTWFKKYSNIVHIDSTFKVNIENYQLYICLVQNANLKGVPVAYCLMKLNDLSETQVVMIDKDLTNAGILQDYFDKAGTLLCVFHVLKYLKVQVHALKISLTNRMNIMNNIRKLLYDNDQMSAIYFKEIKINSEETDFYEYFEKTWLSCCEMWQTKY